MAVNKVLQSNGKPLEVVAHDLGVSVAVLSSWQNKVVTKPARGRAWSGGSRLDAVIATAALNEADKSAWCRERGVFVAQLEQWRTSATAALGESDQGRASAQSTRADKQRIKELERNLLRKDRALAEAAALLVLSKKVEAIYNRGGEE